MKKGLWLPAALLAGILAFCLWNSASMTRSTARWRAQLEEAERLALAAGGDGGVQREKRAVDRPACLFPLARMEKLIGQHPEAPAPVRSRAKGKEPE